MSFSVCDARFSISNEALIVAVSYKTSIIYSNNLKQTNLFGYWLIFLRCKCRAVQTNFCSGWSADKNSLRAPNLKSLGSTEMCRRWKNVFMHFKMRTKSTHTHSDTKSKWIVEKYFGRAVEKFPVEFMYGAHVVKQYLSFFVLQASTWKWSIFCSIFASIWANGTNHGGMNVLTQAL